MAARMIHEREVIDGHEAVPEAEATRNIMTPQKNDSRCRSKGQDFDVEQYILFL